MNSKEYNKLYQHEWRKKNKENSMKKELIEEEMTKKARDFLTSTFKAIREDECQKTVAKIRKKIEPLVRLADVPLLGERAVGYNLALDEVLSILKKPK